jgi:hypothetical protein
LILEALPYVPAEVFSLGDGFKEKCFFDGVSLRKLETLAFFFLL